MNYLKNFLKNNPIESKNLATISYLASIDYLKEKSPVIAESILGELKNQRSQLKLIASENYSSLAVQLAMGNLLTDKYAEGYIGHRFYAGCEHVDVCEKRAADCLKEIYGADHAYVQPHSGADANLIAFWSIISNRIQDKKLQEMGHKNLNDLSAKEYETLRQHLVNCKVLGMSLDSGGHLSHGFRHHISSKMMRAYSYSVNPETEMLDYAEIQKVAKEVKPDILLAGYSAYSRRIDFAKMREIADSIGAVLMVDMAHFAGLVAGKVFKGNENPIPFAHIVTSTTHKTLRGPRGGLILCQKEFQEIVNKGCPLVQGGPLPQMMAAKAVAFEEAKTQSFQDYAQKVVENARALAEVFIKEGLHILSKGTDNHMMVLDVSSLNITGRQAEDALLSCGICSNRNAILNDPNGAWYTSGIRLGTPALTTLGMGPNQMKEIGKIIIDVLKSTKASIHPEKKTPSKAKFELDEKTHQRASNQVIDILKDFPLYPELIIE